MSNVHKGVPSRITILGKPIKIKLVDMSENHGEYTTDPRTIKLDSSESNELASTCFHETLHASLEISGLNEVLGSRTEEAVVRCIENAIWPLIEKDFYKKF